MAGRVKVGDRYVQSVTEGRLVLTDDVEKVRWYTWEGQLKAEKLVDYHMTMNAKRDGTRPTGDEAFEDDQAFKGCYCDRMDGRLCLPCLEDLELALREAGLLPVESD